MITARCVSRGKRTVLLVCFNLALVCIIGSAFYAQDLRYALPTPKPAGFRPGKLNQTIPLPGADGRPTLICFASPDCGCSRFNQDHLWELAKEFKSKVRIIEVIESTEKGGLDSPDETMMDPQAAIARMCGVYSTPQAVVLDQNQKIAYSGNFNAARFCSGAETQFARLALESLLTGRPVPEMPPSATTPYGCAIAAEVGTK